MVTFSSRNMKSSKPPREEEEKCWPNENRCHLNISIALKTLWFFVHCEMLADRSICIQILNLFFVSLPFVPLGFSSSPELSKSTIVNRFINRVDRVNSNRRQIQIFVFSFSIWNCRWHYYFCVSLCRLNRCHLIAIDDFSIVFGWRHLMNPWGRWSNRSISRIASNWKPKSTKMKRLFAHFIVFANAHFAALCNRLLAKPKK